MADNTQVINPQALNAGGDTIATDDVGGVKFQKVKVNLGASGVDGGEVTTTNPFPVVVETTGSPISSPVGDPRIAFAIAYILDEYGDAVTLSRPLYKFGNSTQVAQGTRTSIMSLPSGTLNPAPANIGITPTVNRIDSISSDVLGDTSIPITIDGLVQTGQTGTTVLTRLVQTVNLDATDARTQVSIPTPLRRINRAYNANGGLSADLAGNVYMYLGTSTAGVPDDGTLVDCMIRGTSGVQQSEKAWYVTASDEYVILTGARGDMITKVANARVDLDLQMRFWLGTEQGVWRTQFDFAAGVGGQATEKFDPCLIIPPLTETRFVGDADANNRDVSASFQGYIATF
jgi:hypothetical protein